MTKFNIFICLAIISAACNNKEQQPDASGTFESNEVIISSEATGNIQQLDIEEGSVLEKGQQVGLIDTLQLYLKKKQLLAQVRSTLSQRPNIPAQLAALKVQLSAAEREAGRVANLVKADAATRKQLDDANSQVEALRKQIEAQSSTLGITSGSISQQANPIEVQIEQVNDQLARCYIINPQNGTVLAKYAEANEMTSSGKPLYKIADLSTMVLRAYITGTQFSSVKLQQKVKVLVDAADGKYKTYEGIVEWISDKAEFTPKTIQTKDERANLVYAIKIRVKNDGLLKIGMYADVKF